jgi:hypothetical protein
MAGGSTVAVYGRTEVVQLVKDLIFRERSTWGRDLPVVTLLGPNGTGKTSLLTVLREPWRDHLPVVQLDVADGRYSERRHLLTDIALRLGLYRSRQLGQLRFPRLWVGLVALSAELDGGSGRTPGELRGRLSPDRLDAEVVELIRDSVGDVEDIARLSPRPGLGWLARRSWREAIDSYRALGERQSGDGVAALVDLNRRFRAGSELEREDAEQIVLRAFLEELRDQFLSGWKSLERTVNCLLLLDNVDSQVGQSFLDLLLRERCRNAVQGPGRCDPLLLVVTSGRWLVTQDQRHRPADDDETPPAAALRAWQGADHTRTEESWLLVQPLRDLDPDDVYAMARARHLGDVPGLVRAVYRVTGGHPAGADAAFAFLAQTTGLRSDLGGALHALLDSPSLEELLDHLLEGVESKLREDLVTCAAARRIGPAVFRRLLPDLASTDAQTVRSVLGEHLWAGSGGEFVLHPLLRRLLLRKLAARPEEHRASWVSVHRRLHGYYRAQVEAGNEVATREYLHHGLALGDASPVVDLAIERFDETSAQWFDDLLAIASDPAQPGGVQPSVAERTQAHRFARHLAGLVTMIWTASGTVDPLAAATLDGRIAEVLDILDDGNCGPLLERAEEYRVSKRGWQRAVFTGGRRRRWE